MDLDKALTLQQVGMLGEQHAGGNTVWITKTHAPLNNEKRKFVADKIICVVRNPIEALPSYASLINTLNHSVESS